MTSFYVGVVNVAIVFLELSVLFVLYYRYELLTRQHEACC